MKIAVITEEAPLPTGPYSQAVKASGLLFVSGQLPVDPATGEIVKGDVKAQTERVLKNIKAILEAGDSSLARVVKVSVFLQDLADFPAVNGLFEEYFSIEPPARETIEVSRLPKNVKIEMSAVAVAD